MLGTILSVMLSGFVIGSLARLALPGPDPMPFWFTVFVGLAGSLVGGGIAAALYGGPTHTLDTSSHIFVSLLLEVGAAAGILAAYRCFVQRRPLSGPDAYRFPTRGVGIRRMRDRLRQVGVDPDALSRRPDTPSADGSEPSHDDRVEQLAKLRELHDSGALSDEEYESARERLRRY